MQSEAFDADALVGWFTDHLTDRSRLHALEVASLLDEVSEPTLAALDSSETAAENMRWLSTLSFAESRGETVRLHLLVRDAVIARLVSQDCGRLADLLERSQHYWLGEFRRMTDVGSKYRAIEMIVGMGRYHPALRANYAASDQGQACSVRPGTSRDHASLLDVIGRFEGERSRLINAAWLAHPATRVMAVCDDSDAPAGYLVTLRIRVSDSAAAETAGDPIIAAVLRALQEEGVGPEEEVLIHRTLIARDDYQAPSMVTRHLHSLKILIMWDHKNERVPSHQVSVYGEGDVWESSATSAGLARMRSCETPLEGRVYTPYVVSLREFPVEEWFLRASARIVEALRAQGSGMK